MQVCLRSKSVHHPALCAATFHAASATLKSPIVNSFWVDNSLRRETLKTHVRDCYCRAPKHFVISPNSLELNRIKVMEDIKTTPGFCPSCGSILPNLRATGKVKCFTCLVDWPPEGKKSHSLLSLPDRIHSLFLSVPVFGDMKSEFTIPFNTYNKRKNVAKEEDSDEGPIVERVCPKCGNDQMSYATLQLRSADEGQTVFYTCTKCQ